MVAFAAAVTRCHAGLSEVGKKRLRGSLLGGLKTDDGLSSLQHEFSTVVHLIRQGLDVEFHDLENGGGFDFIVKGKGIEAEVECKLFSADLGRQIHRRKAAKLFGALSGQSNQIFQAINGGLIVRVFISGRLTSGLKQQIGIQDALSKGVLSGEKGYSSGEVDVEIVRFDLPGTPFDGRNVGTPSHKELMGFVRERTGGRDTHMMCMGSPGRRALVIEVQSRERDDVLDGMRRQLKRAAGGQFSGRRPAFLAVQLRDLTSQQMLDLANSDSTTRELASGLQRMTSDFLQSKNRRHIHTVVYKAQDNLTEKFPSGESNSVAYLIKNQFHNSYGDGRYNLFSDESRQPSRIVI